MYSATRPSGGNRRQNGSANTMAKYSENDLKASVGKHGPAGKQCYNTTTDQEMVQYLLNAIPESYGGCDGKLKSSPRWGMVSDELYKAILISDGAC